MERKDSAQGKIKDEDRCTSLAFPLCAEGLRSGSGGVRSGATLTARIAPLRRHWRFSGWLASLIILVGIGEAALIEACPWRIILSDSAAPSGIYSLHSAEPRRGDLVLACLPPPLAAWAMQRRYIAAGTCPDGSEPLAKILGGKSGDVVAIEREFVAVNDVPYPHSETADRDSHGRTLSHVSWGVLVVAPGEVWLFGFNNPRSWDARYFGPIPASNLRGVLRPIITW